MWPVVDNVYNRHENAYNFRGKTQNKWIILWITKIIVDKFLNFS